MQFSLTMFLGWREIHSKPGLSSSFLVITILWHQADGSPKGLSLGLLIPHHSLSAPLLLLAILGNNCWCSSNYWFGRRINMQFNVWASHANKGLMRAGVECGGREALDEPLFHLFIILWNVSKMQLFWSWRWKSARFTVACLCIDF